MPEQQHRERREGVSSRTRDNDNLFSFNDMYCFSHNGCEMAGLACNGPDKQKE
jgi:hypothetical protein